MILQAPPTTHRSYLVFSVTPKYAKIDQHGIWNILSINRLAKVAKEERSNVNVTSKLRTNVNISPAKKVLAKGQNNSYAVAKVFGHYNRPTGTYYNVRRCG